MIDLKDINVVFGEGTPNRNHVLRDLSLHVGEGDFITIIGSNGAGKSTLFNTISGNIFSTSGSIYFDGRDVTKEQEFMRARYMGRIFQDPLLGTAGNMTVEDNMILAVKKGMKGLRISLNNKCREEFKKHLCQLNMGLEDRLRDSVGRFSGGQRQALTMLMTVLSKPRLVLLDEHTAALDPRNAQQVMDLTMEFIEKYSLTVMMITHNMHHAITYGNRLMMMDRGKIIFEVSGAEKQSLTIPELIEKFHAVRGETFTNDEALLQ